MCDSHFLYHFLYFMYHMRTRAACPQSSTGSHAGLDLIQINLYCQSIDLLCADASHSLAVKSGVPCTTLYCVYKFCGGGGDEQHLGTYCFSYNVMYKPSQWYFCDVVDQLCKISLLQTKMQRARWKKHSISGILHYLVSQ